MSSYTNYDVTSNNYDDKRKAVGVDYMLGALHVHCGVPLSELHVLDAGCGTGNYAKALLDAGIGKITALDGSKGMLDQSRKKLTKEINNGRLASIQQHYLPELPFKDQTFDVVMFNQVLHHLSTKPTDSDISPVAEKALIEANRVLKTGGIILVTTTLPHQILNGYWQYKLIPEAAQRFANRYLSLNFFRKSLSQAGFGEMHALVPHNEFHELLDVDEGSYLLQEKWRATDSFWSSASETEIANMENNVKQMLEEGTLKAYAKENSKDMVLVGHHAVVYAKKPF